jgi:UDP-2-acetamido-3-amino-2,3-dideoxy-glucuronate N-acetyltransferase
VAQAPVNDAPYRIIRDVELGDGVVVYSHVNLYDCTIGDGTRIGAFVEIESGVRIGARCKVQSHSYVCGGVVIGDGAFIGHGVVFVNDKYPRSTNADGDLQTSDDWERLETRIGNGASIGSNATVLGGVRVGDGAIVGAGAVVTRDVAPGATVAGNPARPVRSRREVVAA